MQLLLMNLRGNAYHNQGGRPELPVRRWRRCHIVLGMYSREEIAEFRRQLAKRSAYRRRQHRSQ